MPRYKEVSLLSDVDAAYVAGLIDGEGSITLSKRHADDMRQLVVSIANCELQLLNFVITCVGAGKITRKRVSKAHHSLSYAWSISNRQALALIQQVHPYLRTHKKARARLVLESYLDVVPRNGKYSPELKSLRAKFEQDFFAISVRELKPPV